jgi:hypothetical protein
MAGWSIDVVGARAAVDRAAAAGSTMQRASVDVQRALGCLVTALDGTAAGPAAERFAAAHRDDAPAAVRAVATTITAATDAMRVFATADVVMATTTERSAATIRD